MTINAFQMVGNFVLKREYFCGFFYELWRSLKWIMFMFKIIDKVLKILSNEIIKRGEKGNSMIIRIYIDCRL